MTLRFAPRLLAVLAVLSPPLVSVLAAQNPDSIPAPAPVVVPVVPQLPFGTGRIVGRILDEATGAPISGARVGIAAGGVSVPSGIDGRYTLMNIPSGPTAIAVRAIGYAPKTVSGIEVPAGGVVSQDITMAPQGVQLEEITVEAVQERGTVARAIDEQRSATTVVNAVTAEEIARSPDADAAQAVQRVSGVTVQDGRYVIVRGLGERYTTTSFNGARVPSPEPDRKVVPLDMFPSSLLEGVTTTKTFTPDQPGDFSGAQVNLRTREFDRGRVLTWSASTSFNTAVTGRTVALAPRTGGEWLGLVSAARELPGLLAARPAGLIGVPDAELPGLIGSFRDTWNATPGAPSPGGSTSFSVGGEDPVLGHLFGYIGSVTYNYGTEIRRDEQRALAISDGQGGAAPLNVYRGGTVTGSVLWGAIANLTTRFGSNTKLSFNNTYNRSADNSAVRIAGVHEQNGTLDFTRLQYVTRSVRSNQLTAEHLLAGRHTVQWMVTSSGVTRDEPDRSDLGYRAAIDSATGNVTRTTWFSGPQGGNRTFSSVSESGWQFDASLRWALGGPNGAAVKVGGQYRTTDRDAQTRSYDISNVSVPDSQLTLPAEQIFRMTSQLDLDPSPSQGGSFTASDRLSAAYAMVELPVTARIRLIGGARLEHSDVAVTTVATTGLVDVAAPRTNDVLPSLLANVDLGGNHQLRLAATQTLSRPEYRELSSVCYAELGGLISCGTPGLRRALIQNYDARWEWYPRGGEIVSIGVFAKSFQHPIERILVATTGANQIGLVNTTSAFNYGVELELRKNLGALAEALLPFSLSVNATLMRSRISVGNDSVSSLTNNVRPMTGQSPYVLNIGLGYTPGSGRMSATVLYNISGRRISEAGVAPIPDTYEEARSALDASWRYDLWRHLSLKFDARNLLDAPYRTTAGSVSRLRYTVGRGFTMGLTWKP